MQNGAIALISLEADPHYLSQGSHSNNRAARNAKIKSLQILIPIYGVPNLDKFCRNQFHILPRAS